MGEVRSVMGESSLVDSAVGPIVFALVNGFAGPTAAVAAGLAVAGVVVGVRLVQRRPATYAFSGVVATVAASGLVLLTGRAEDYFLPGIITGALTAVAILVSILVRRPFVALTSAVVRGWPLGWFRHPRVRPAYTLVSWLWFAFFGLRAFVQYLLYRQGEVGLLAAARVAMGWPGILVLLAVTYVVGRWRLDRLGGPSVEEWESGAEPPWEGRQHGF